MALSRLGTFDQVHLPRTKFKNWSEFSRPISGSSGERPRQGHQATETYRLSEVPCHNSTFSTGPLASGLIFTVTGELWYHLRR